LTEKTIDLLAKGIAFGMTTDFDEGSVIKEYKKHILKQLNDKDEGDTRVRNVT